MDYWPIKLDNDLVSMNAVPCTLSNMLLIMIGSRDLQ